MIQNNYSSSTAFGSFYGCITEHVKQYILSILPPNTIKDIYIEDSLASISQYKSDITKLNKPYLALRPKVEIDNENLYAGRDPDFYQTSHYVLSKNQAGNYPPVLVDHRLKKYIYVVPQRFKFSFDFEIVCNSKLEQLNLAFNMKNTVMHNAYFFIKRFIETEIPKPIIYSLAKVLNLNLELPHDINDLSNYMFDNSNTYITRKIKASTGNFAYFYGYMSSIMVNIQNMPTIDDGNRNNSISEDFKISNNITFELAIPAMYILNSKDLIQIEPDKLPDSDIYGINDYVLMYDTFRFKKSLFLDNGFEFDNFITIVTEDGQTLLASDSTNISHILSRKHNLCLAHIKKFNLDLNNYFKIIVKDTSSTEITTFNFDWYSHIITLTDIKPNSSYFISLYINRPEINKLYERIIERDGLLYNK